MKIFEFIIAMSIMAILFSFFNIKHNHALQVAHHTLQSHLKMMQVLSLSDMNEFVELRSVDYFAQKYPSINRTALLSYHQNAMWQMQFHLGRIYTTNSYSIYIDTPRSAQTTNFDGRPMAGDIIAKDLDRRCISGYSNTNTAVDCKNNTLTEVRLKERFGVDNILVESDGFCQERDTARIYFDSLGRPYCGRIPMPLQNVFKIILLKNAQQKHLCILPYSGLITAEC
ncbi:hypothetical protein LS68_000510 [Helicobacter sp. MIT 05-5293]|nr:hypothetical protein LS68_000510 [Helicobacter sp. MIT 05-5293]